jgi:hypothetical protein
LQAVVLEKSELHRFSRSDLTSKSKPADVRLESASEALEAGLVLPSVLPATATRFEERLSFLDGFVGKGKQAGSLPLLLFDLAEGRSCEALRVPP